MNYPATHDAPVPSTLITSGSLSYPLHEITSQIVAAYVSHHAMPASDVPQFIAQVYGAVAGLGAPAAPAEPEAQVPAVPIKKSITPDYIVCLDDGLKFRSLKRHLATLGMTPEQYRAKWSLPEDYPMVSPRYSEQRSALAKANGLGTKR